MTLVTLLGGSVVLKCNGIYIEATLYAQGDHVFARCFHGFIKLKQKNATSHPKVFCREIDLIQATRFDFAGMAI